jgi:bifunctional non-homologous end joining protein LigD
MEKRMLEDYNRKRNFKATPEPSGIDSSASKDSPQNNKSGFAIKPRFVIQKHDATHLHYDFRLESKKNNALISWAVPKGPSLNPKVKRLAILTEDHPTDYLLFEGVIPEGNYGAGSVIVWDTGTYSLEVTKGRDMEEEGEEEDVAEQFEGGKVNFTLFGQKLKGRFSIIKTTIENQWLLIKVNDKRSFSSSSQKEEEETDLTKSRPESVLSGLTNDEIKNSSAFITRKELKDNTEIKKDIETNTDNDDVTNNRRPTICGGATANSLSLHSSLHVQEFSNDVIHPMLATLVNSPPFKSQDWAFEIKWDGVRSVSFIHKLGAKFKIQSRNGKTITHRYPELEEPLKSSIKENQSVVFDGEIVILDKNGYPDFQSHQKRMNIDSKRDIEALSRQFPATYYIFDILHLDGYDLKTLPLTERRKILDYLLRSDNKNNQRIRISEFIEGEGNDIFESIKRMNLEGMVVKHKLSRYHPDTRSREWLKIKNTKSQDCVVIGYTRGEGNREKYFGSLLLAAMSSNKPTDYNKFKFVGHCGSGFDHKQLPTIYNKLEKIKTEKCPIDCVPYTNRETTWVKPALVAEIKYDDWTNEKIMRAPIFLRFREDKNPQDCAIEENDKTALGNAIPSEKKTSDNGKTETQLAKTKYKGDSNSKYNRVFSQTAKSPASKIYHNFSNLDKMYWGKTKGHSSITKMDLIEYYDQVSQLILPHLKDRPLSLNRYPDGICGNSFYHKNWQSERPEYVQTTKVYSKSSGKAINYLLCNNKETLLWLANLGCIEMNPWYSRINNYDLKDSKDNFGSGNCGLEHPDFIVFDLDPYIYSGNENKHQEPEYNLKAFKATVETAYCLKEIFDELNIKSFVKTSGKTGLHIFIPIINLYTYEQTRSFARVIGRTLAKRLPDKITTAWNTADRRGKVFFDYNQNAQGKTIASIFSPRPVESATVSMPLEWNNLSQIIPTDFTITNVAEIFKKTKDPWKNILIEKQDLVKILNSISQIS